MRRNSPRLVRSKIIMAIVSMKTEQITYPNCFHPSEECEQFLSGERIQRFVDSLGCFSSLQRCHMK